MPAALVQKIQTGLLSFFSPIMKTVVEIREAIDLHVKSSLLTHTQWQQHMRILSLENAKLRTTIKLMEGLQEENDRLRNALAYRAHSVFRIISAQVIFHNNFATWWNTILINRGFQDGLEINMPVLAEGGIVGKITAVGNGVSTVLLITDENCKVAATVEGSHEKGIVSGTRVVDNDSILLDLSFLSKNARIDAGKRVYTAGVDGGIFPAGVLIGTVQYIHSRELDSQAQLKPAVNLSCLEDVFVVMRDK